VESCGLFQEDAWDKDQWRLRIRGLFANPGLLRKWPLKWNVCVHVRVCKSH